MEQEDDDFNYSNDWLGDVAEQWRIIPQGMKRDKDDDAEVMQVKWKKFPGEATRELQTTFQDVIRKIELGKKLQNPKLVRDILKNPDGRTTIGGISMSNHSIIEEYNLKR